MENPYVSRKWKPSNSMGRLKAGGDYRREVIDGLATVRSRRVMSKVGLLVARKAWEEAKAEQAEIVSDLKATIVAYEIAISREEKLVSELVEAFKYYIAYGARTTTTSGRIAWKKARTVIAKATGI